MCGSDEQLFRTKIEGTEIKVCKSCAGFGEILCPVKEDIIEKKKKDGKKIEVVSEPEIIETIVSGFPQILKKKREELGLNQEDFAKKISEKQSILHKMETGEFMPSINTARKIEKILKIKVIEEYEEKGQDIEQQKGKGEVTTIGDMIKIRKR